MYVWPPKALNRHLYDSPHHHLDGGQPALSGFGEHLNFTDSLLGQSAACPNPSLLRVKINSNVKSYKGEVSPRPSSTQGEKIP